jgi:tetratricopeptide (TPR) repeat protein
MVLLFCALVVYVSVRAGAFKKLSGLWNPYRSQIQQFEEALQQGRLVQPPGQSAYDLYLQFKADAHFPSRDLQELRLRALPLLEETTEEVFRRWHDDGRLVKFPDWSGVCRLSEWIFEVKGDNVSQARLAYCRGQLAFVAKDYQAAEQWYQQALTFYPDWALALNGLGRCYVRKRDLAQAEGSYKAAAAAEPGWAYPYLNLGALYAQNRQYEQAEQAYKQALELAPKNPYISYALGQLYLQMGRQADACQAFRNAWQVGQEQPSQNAGFDSKELSRLMERLGC